MTDLKSSVTVTTEGLLCPFCQHELALAKFSVTYEPQYTKHLTLCCRNTNCPAVEPLTEAEARKQLVCPNCGDEWAGPLPPVGSLVICTRCRTGWNFPLPFQPEEQ